MQKGRVYRHAIPRCTFNDMPWNHRAPYRVQLDGFVIWDGLDLVMNTGPHALAVFTALRVEFLFESTFTGAGNTFSWYLRQRPWPTGEGAEIVFHIDDGLGGVAEKVWRWMLHDPAWGIIGFPEFSLLQSSTYTGGFAPGHFFLQPTCVVYALEP